MKKDKRIDWKIDNELYRLCRNNMYKSISTVGSFNNYTKFQKKFEGKVNVYKR